MNTTLTQLATEQEYEIIRNEDGGVVLYNPAEEITPTITTEALYRFPTEAEAIDFLVGNIEAEAELDAGAAMLASRKAATPPADDFDFDAPATPEMIEAARAATGAQIFVALGTTKILEAARTRLRAGDLDLDWGS